MLNLTESKADKEIVETAKKLASLFGYYLNEYAIQNKPSTSESDFFKSSNNINLKHDIASTYITELDNIETALSCQYIDWDSIKQLDALLLQISQDEKVAPKVKAEIKAAAKNSDVLEEMVSNYMNSSSKTEAQDDKHIIDAAKELASLFGYYLNEYAIQNKPSPSQSDFFKSSNNINLQYVSTYIQRLDNIEAALSCQYIDRESITDLHALLSDISQDEKVDPKVKAEIKAAAKNSNKYVEEMVSNYMNSSSKTEMASNNNFTI